jgi:hypothetical protein
MKRIFKLAPLNTTKSPKLADLGVPGVKTLPIFVESCEVSIFRSTLNRHQDLFGGDSASYPKVCFFN